MLLKYPKRASLLVPSQWLQACGDDCPARPAMVLETQSPPVALSRRTVKLPASATNTLPPLSTATAEGLKKRAALLVPSSLPGLPADPATVLETQLVPTGVSL